MQSSLDLFLPETLICCYFLTISNDVENLHDATQTQMITDKIFFIVTFHLIPSWLKNYIKICKISILAQNI